MLPGCGGYAGGARSTSDTADNWDRQAKSVGKVDTASEELRDLAVRFAVNAVSNNISQLICFIPNCMHVCIGFMWSIYSYHCCISCMGDHLLGSWL